MNRKRRDGTIASEREATETAWEIWCAMPQSERDRLREFLAQPDPLFCQSDYQRKGEPIIREQRAAASS